MLFLAGDGCLVGEGDLVVDLCFVGKVTFGGDRRTGDSRELFVGDMVVEDSSFDDVDFSEGPDHPGTFWDDESERWSLGYKI